MAGRDASLRVFGTGPGDYGAGINRLAERSGAWTDRKELAQVYLGRIGHAYRSDGAPTVRQDLLRANLNTVRNTYLGRASNLYGLMDNNDAFDYLGGLSLAVETVSGQRAGELRRRSFEQQQAEHAGAAGGARRRAARPVPESGLDQASHAARLRGRSHDRQRVHRVPVGLAGDQSRHHQELGVG